MPYQSKTYSLSDEAIKRLTALKVKYGSVNKGLLKVLPQTGTKPSKSGFKRRKDGEKV